MFSNITFAIMTLLSHMFIFQEKLKVCRHETESYFIDGNKTAGSVGLVFWRHYQIKRFKGFSAILKVLVGWDRRFIVCCLAHRGSTGDSLSLHISVVFFDFQ